MEYREWQVFVGRFQPPNNGHRDILKLAFGAHPGPFLIGVVWAESTNYTSSTALANPKHSLSGHPFSVWERIHLLSLVVASLAPAVEVRIHVVPRFDNPDGKVFRQFMPERYRRTKGISLVGKIVVKRTRSCSAYRSIQSAVLT